MYRITALSSATALLLCATTGAVAVPVNYQLSGRVTEVIDSYPGFDPVVGEAVRGTIALDPAGAVDMGDGYQEDWATTYGLTFGGLTFTGGAGAGSPYALIAPGTFSVWSESIGESLPALPAGASFGISFMNIGLSFAGSPFDPALYPQTLPVGQFASGSFEVGYFYYDASDSPREFSVRGELAGLREPAAPVPEPGPLPLLALGLLGAAAARWARVRASA